MKDLSEVAFILLQHLLRLVEGVIAVAKYIDQARVQSAVRVLIIAPDASGEISVAVETGGLLQDRAQHIEVMRV
jgi:hypothetical protein